MDSYKNFSNSGYGVDYRGLYDEKLKSDNFLINISNINNDIGKCCDDVFDCDRIDINKDQKVRLEEGLDGQKNITARILYASFLMLVCVGLLTVIVDCIDIDNLNLIVSKISDRIYMNVKDRGDIEQRSIW